MLKILSFDLEGDFAAFRDPSVTTNQTVYLIPSKTQIIGMLGAILGIERGHELKELYSKEFIEFLAAAKIGIKVKSEPDKISFFTNHRSLKEPKMKPVKSEVLLKPKYTIYIQTNEDNYEKLKQALSNNEFKYSPFLGHAYCPARISGANTHTAKEVSLRNITVGTVVLDESIETFGRTSSLKNLELEKGNVRLIVERHLHNFVKGNELKKTVLRHWIPLQDGKIVFDYEPKLKITNFLELSSKPEEIICFY